MVRRALIAAGLFGLAFGSGSAGAQTREVVVGVLYPFTGPAAQIAIDHRHAVEVAVDIVNNRHDGVNLPLARTEGLPGLGGAKLRVVFADSQGKPEVGQAEAERLITQEKVQALVGAWHSSVTATASQVAERFGVPFLNPESTSPALTRRGFKGFFRTTPHDEQFTQAMFDFLRDFQAKRGLKFRTVGITHEDTLFGADSGKIMRELAKKYGYEIVTDMSYRARATSLASEVQRLKAANPDVWMPTAYQTDAILFVKTAKELDWNWKMVLAQAGGYVDPAFLQAVGREAEGSISRTPFVADQIPRSPLARQVNALFVKRAGRDLYDSPVRGFDGFMALVDAINRAGSTSPEALRQALRETNIPAAQIVMPWTGIRFDETGQNVGARVMMMQLQGGKYWTVWPFEIATKEVMHPIPKWSERK
jgi:branched-chain amino acid transport system substrate-binding protein